MSDPQQPRGWPPGGVPTGPGGYWQQFDGSQRPPGGYPYHPGQGPLGPRVDQMAILSLVLSLVGFVAAGWCPVLPLGFGAAGVVLGVLALRRIRRDPERLKGRGLAIGGAIAGGVAVALFVFLAIVMGTMFALEGAGR